MIVDWVRHTSVEKHLVYDDIAYGGPLDEPPLHLATETASKESVRVRITVTITKQHSNTQLAATIRSH